MNTELWTIHQLTGSNKHGKSANDKQVSDLVKLTCQEFIIRKHTLEHENYMLQELNMAKQGMTWSYSKHLPKVP